MSAHDETIRKHIRGALKQYRDSYLPLTRAVIAEQPGRYGGVTAESLADMTTSFIEGCALRLVTEPGRYDAQSCSAVLTAILSQPHPQTNSN